jgi:hypothetical protein
MLDDPLVVKRKNYRTVFKQLVRDQRRNKWIYEMPEWLESAIDTYLTDYHAQAPMDTRERILVRTHYASGSDERDRRAFIRALGKLVAALVVGAAAVTALFNFGNLVPDILRPMVLVLYGSAFVYYIVIVYFEVTGPTKASLVTGLVEVLMTDRLERTKNGRPH